MNSRPLMKDASVAFVILTWNSEKYVKACLESVLNLQCRQLRVYVVDNGSSDGTLDIIKSLLKKSEHLKLTALPHNVGVSVSRNIALRSLSDDVDYVCVLDSDTVINQQACEKMTSVLHDDTANKIGLIGPQLHNSQGEVQLSGRVLPTIGLKIRKACPIASIRNRAEEDERMLSQDNSKQNLQDVGYLLSACWFIPYKTFSTVGLLDEKIFYGPEDVDYCVRVHKAGWRVVYCPQTSIIHEYQRISRRKFFSKTNWKHLTGLLYYFKKYRGIAQGKKRNG